jgi:3-oxoacyl-[acyl-carrier-protein] synthase-1
MDSHGQIAITNVGMTCSLGHDAATACAASRAGITRPKRLDYFRVRSPEAGVEQVLGHAAPSIATGFEDRVRLIQLLAAGLGDLRASIGGKLSDFAGFYLSMPSPLRPVTGLALIEHEEDRAVRLRICGEAGPEVLSQSAAQSLVSEAAELAGWPDRPDLRFVSCAGHAGVAEATQHAMTDLRSGAIVGAIVGGVDSLLDYQTLAWLHTTGRLKTSDRPAGLQPGEACALVGLKTMRNIPSRARPPVALIREVWTGVERATLLSGEAPPGNGLSQALMPAADASRQDTAGCAWLITDQNGETYRAVEWGNAVCRVAARYPAFSTAAIWYPALSFGDTGAASGALSICVAAKSFERGYARLASAVVASSSDGPLRAALLVSAAERIPVR